MQGDPGRSWPVGAIANDHVLAQGGRWARLNHRAYQFGPWQPGDVVNDHAFTGVSWVRLPAGWRPDPTARHQLRWWTGTSWSSQAQTQGRRFDDPLVPPAPSLPAAPTYFSQSSRAAAPNQSPHGCLWFLGTIPAVFYGGFWLIIAIYSASIAATENEPRYLLLTSTASLNIFLFTLTGETRSELNRRARRAAKGKLPYLLCGAIAAGGVWLGLHFDNQTLILIFLAVALIVLMFAWLSS